MVSIVLAASKESEAELEQLGFQKTEVWLKYDRGGGTTAEAKPRVEGEMFRMKHPPFMFLASSWWGAGPD